MSDERLLREAIHLMISEALGSMRNRTFRGTGASNPVYIHSDKQRLGDNFFMRNDDMEGFVSGVKIKKGKEKIKVSKAFDEDPLEDSEF